MLGLGLGLSKGTNLLSNLKLLTRNSDFAFWGDKASGQSFPTLAERTLPNGVKNSIHTKNVSDDYIVPIDAPLLNEFTGTNVQGWSINFASMSIAGSNSTIQGKLVATDTQGTLMNEVTFNNRDLISSIGKYVTRGDGRCSFVFPLGTTIEQARVLLAGTVIRYQLAVPIDTLNSPQVNPIQDLVGGVGKNLVDIFALGNAYVNTVYLGNKFRFNALSGAATTTPYFKNRDFKPNIQYTISGIWSQPAANNYKFKFVYTDATSENQSVNPTASPTAFSFTSSVGKTIDYIAIVYSTTLGGNYTEVENLQLEEGTVATAYEPYGKANGLLQGFGFTPASGYVDVVAPNGKTVTGIQGDGVNDVILLPSNAPNPTSGNFAFGLIVKTGANKVKYLLTRNVTNDADTQYAFKFDASGNLFVILEGVAIQIGTALSVGFHSIWLERDSSTLKAFIDGVETYSGTHSTTLTSRANTVMIASTTGTGTYTGFSNDILLASKYCDSDIATNRADWFKFDTKVYGL